MQDDEDDMSNDLENDDKTTRDILMAEYQTITRQLIHWDTFFWTKSRFFLIFEGVALLGTIDKLISKLPGQVGSGTTPRWPTEAMELQSFGILLGVGLLNMFLCYVWRMSGVRNRDFLTFRFERGLEIETHRVFQAQQEPKPLIRLYHHQEKRLESPPLKGTCPPHHWEMFIPIAFGFVWLCVIAYGSRLLKDYWYYGLIVSLLIVGFIYGLMRIQEWNWIEKRESSHRNYTPETVCKK